MLKTALRALSLLLFAVGLVGCTAVAYLLNLLFAPPPPTQQPGNFVAYGVDYYAVGGSIPGNTSALGAKNFANAFTAAGWGQLDIPILTDAQVTGGSFSSSNGSADVLYFRGHGVPGLVALSEQYVSSFPAANQAWGVGNTSGSFSGQVLKYSSAGLPASGRLKWIFLNSSDSVAGPPEYDSTDPDWTANWRKAFGGSLHGVYGSWQAPGSCASQGNPLRTCDIQSDNDIDQLFAGYALPNPNSSAVPPINQGGYVHDAWMSAMQDAGYDSSWSEWEDVFAGTDIVSGPGAGAVPPSYTPVLNGTAQFYYNASTIGNVMTPMTVKRNTFTLNPQSLTNESINHAALAQQFATYLPSPAIHDDGITYTVRQWPAVFQHVYGRSGAVAYASPAKLKLWHSLKTRLFRRRKLLWLAFLECRRTRSLRHRLNVGRLRRHGARRSR